MSGPSSIRTNSLEEIRSRINDCIAIAAVHLSSRSELAWVGHRPNAEGITALLAAIGGDILRNPAYDDIVHAMAQAKGTASPFTHIVRGAMLEIARVDDPSQIIPHYFFPADRDAEVMLVFVFRPGMANEALSKLKMKKELANVERIVLAGMS